MSDLKTIKHDLPAYAPGSKGGGLPVVLFKLNVAGKVDADGLERFEIDYLNVLWQTMVMLCDVFVGVLFLGPRPAPAVVRGRRRDLAMLIASASDVDDLVLDPGRLPDRVEQGPGRPRHPRAPGAAVPGLVPVSTSSLRVRIAKEWQSLGRYFW